MSELTALTRLLYARHRQTFKAFLITGVTLIVTLWLVGVVVPNRQDNFSPYRFLLSIWAFPACLWGILLLDFYRSTEVTRAEGTFEAWLLRTPIATWKLAAIPIAAKSIWLIGVCVISAMIFRNPLEDLAPTGMGLSAGIGMVSMATSLSAVLWRPIQSDWWRVVWLTIVGIGGYAAILFCVGAMFEEPDWRLKAAGLVTLVVWLVVSIVQAYRSVDLARSNVPVFASPVHNSVQARPGQSESLESPKEPSPAWLGRWPVLEQLGLSWRGSLQRHDLLRAWRTGRQIVPWFLAMATFFAVVDLPMSIFVVLWSGIAFVFCTVLGSMCFEQTGRQLRSTLPDYLIASPITAEQIAWKRIRGAAMVAAVGGLSALSVTFFCAWFRYFGDGGIGWGLMSAELLDPTVVTIDKHWLLVRAMSAIAIGGLTVLTGAGVGYIWLPASGRDSLVFFVFGLVTTIGLVVFGLALTWFLGHSSWEAVQQDVAWARTWVPSLVVGALVTKVVGTSVVAFYATRRGDLAWKNLLRCVLIWGIVVLVIGVLVSTISPHRSFTSLNCLAGLALSLPLTGVLLTPSMVGWNMHR